jgi:hypothetical protein
MPGRCSRIGTGGHDVSDWLCFDLASLSFLELINKATRLSRFFGKAGNAKHCQQVYYLLGLANFVSLRPFEKLKYRNNLLLLMCQRLIIMQVLP